MKKICVVTGTRAEYGLLKPIINKISKDDELELCLVVTGMHLSPEFGMTYREIEHDGYKISRKIEMLLSADTPSSIVKSMGIEMIGFADVYAEEQPDMVVLLGDRYEILVAATAAMVHRIPIAHIHGGESTEGAMDEAIRHSVTKMSMLHFASTEAYKRRIIQLGEQPKRVFCVGALGVENIKSLTLLAKKELEEAIQFSFDKRTVMVTYHPVTLENTTAEEQFTNLLGVLKEQKELKIIFTKANADTDGRIINQMIDGFVLENPDRSIAFTSMGQLRYLSALQYCVAVIGNSSSGIVEAPSFGIPTVDIGERQKGRVCAESVVHCGTKKSEIESAVEEALSSEFRSKAKQVINPYEGVDTSKRIIDVIKEYLNQDIGLKKQFYDINDEETVR